MGFLDDLKKKALELGSRAWDQVNVADGGRTWQQRTPTKSGGVGSQLYNSGASNALARPAGRTFQRTANSLSAVPASLGGLVWMGKESVLGTDKSYQNAVDTTADALDDIADRGWGGQGSYFSSKNINSSGDGIQGFKENFIKPTTKAVADVTPYVVPMGKLGQGANLARRAAVQGAANAVASGGTDMAAQYANNGKIDPRQTAQATLLGGIIGAGVPVAGAVLKGGAQKALAGYDNRTPLNQSGHVQVPGGKVPAPDAPIPGKTPLSATPPPKTKLSRFANKTVPGSDEVSPNLQKMVKEEAVSYDPHTNAGRLEAADKWLGGKNNESAFTGIIKKFENSKTATDQDVVTAIQLAKRLDTSGKEDDLFKATEIYDNLSRFLTEKGQQVQAASLLNNRTPQGLVYTAQKNLRKAGVEVSPEIQQQIKSLVDNIKAQKPGSYEDGLARYQLMDFVSKKVPTNNAAKGVHLWKAGLLTAPTTTGGNLLGNTGEQIYKRAWNDPVAAGADLVMSLFTGKRSKSLTYRGIGQGVKEGGAKGVSYFKTGYDPRNPLAKFDVKDIHFSDSSLGRAAEKYTQGVFRLMGSQDQPFYYGSMRNSLYDQAITTAKNSGLKGTAREQFIKKFITQPSKEALELADKEARYDVFQNKTKLGDLASGIKDKSGAAGDFIVPFSQVPSSIATRMIDRTPIGLGKEIVKQIKAGNFDQRAMSRAIADGSAGIAIMGAGAALAKDGQITLGYPQDQKERDLWELEGKQPNSIKIGNTWVSLNYFQPLGTLMAAGANYQTALDTGQDKQGAFAAAAAGAGKALTEQSFLKGVSGTLNALTDPQRSAEKFAENTAGSIVPNFVRSFARSADPVNRQQDGMGQSIMAGIPGLRGKLDVRTDIFGEAVPRKTGAVNSFLNPLKPSDARQPNQLTSELRRLQDADEGITATKIMKDALGGDTKLNAKQQLELKNEVGTMLKKGWSEIISDPRYASLSDADKKKRLESVKNDITGAMKAKYAVEKMQLPPDPKKLSRGERGVLLGKDKDYLARSGSSSTGYVDINANLDSESRKVLETHSTLDSDSEDELFKKTPDAEYKYLKAKYENDKANGTLSKAQDVRRRTELQKSKAGAKFPAEVRELYGLSKAQAYTLLTEDKKNGKKLAEQLVAYGDALVKSGVNSYNKFKDRYGNISLAPKGRGGSRGGRGRGGGKGKKGSESMAALISAVSSASRQNRNAKVSTKASFQSKVARPGLKAYKKPASKKVAVTKKQLARSRA